MVASVSGVLLSKRGDDVHITLYQGKTVRFSLIHGGYNPVDVTGWGAKLQFRSAVDSPTVVLEISTANSRVTVGGVDGKFDFLVPDDVTAALTAGDGVWDCELYPPTGETYLGESGTYTIVPKVTRA